MPGTIRVSVLEAVDLPDVLTDGTIGKDVTAKVTLGPKLFKTKPGVADGGKIASWNSDFAFPVMNLRDKLVISICDSEDHSVTQTAIEIPSIIQKGSRDEFVALNKGGRIHLRISFVLSEEERKKIEVMRVAALKRKEEAERVKKTVVMQPVTPEKEPKKSPVSTVAIAEVDLSTIEGDKKDLKEPASGPLNDRKDATIPGDKKESTVNLGDKKDSTEKKDSTILGDKTNSTPKPPAPKPMFNYAKAIGMPPSAKKTVKKPSAAVSDSSTTELKAGNGDVSSGMQTVRESAKDAGEVVSSETTKLDASVEADSTAPSADSTPHGSPIPAGEVDNVNNDVKAIQSGRESAENVEELGDTKLAVAAPADGVAQANPPATEVESGVPENEVGEADKDGMGPAENPEDVSSSIQHESSSLIIAPAADSPFREHLQLALRSFPSGQVTLRTVKARVKRTLSRVSSRRSSNRASSANSLSRSPAPVPVVWVQEVVRRALTNVKGCYGLNPSTVNH